MTKVLELWETHCIGKTNVIYERYKFNNRSQEQTESIDTYANALRALAETCDFGALKNPLIRDRIVCGVRDNAVRRKLLQESKLTLEKCVDIILSRRRSYFCAAQRNGAKPTATKPCQ